MQTIVKFICLFVAFFVIVNGCFAFFMPPDGDALLAFVLIAVGLFIAFLTLTMSQYETRS
jgi:hypothetical protein